MRNCGLEYVKCDFHIHTPASHDYVDKSKTAKDIVTECLSKGIKAIAITDHNTGDFINQIKIEAKDKLTVFPGVEITCQGGQNGLHIISIFDTDKNQSTIFELLSRVGIGAEMYGKKEALATKSIYEIVNIIDEMSGLVIFPHCNSNKGILNEIRGTQRNSIFKLNAVMGFECSIDDFKNETKKTEHKRLIDILDGNDSNYNKKKMAVYTASDAHSISDIGKNYTWFKVDREEFGLESIRQSFIDRDVRILQSSEYNECVIPYIKSMEINSGFFDGEKLEFHSGLNSIIGSKGAGKSLLVELLRFGFDNNSNDNDILLDHNSKLNKKLKDFGNVKIEYIDETNREIKLVKTYKTLGSEYQDFEQELNANAFKILFLSQNEIIRIAEDSDKQMKFIDTFFDFKQYISKINNIKKDLETLDRKFAQSINAISNKENLQKELKGYVVELKKIEEQLKSKEYTKFKIVENVNTKFLDISKNFIRMQEDLQLFEDKIKVSYTINQIDETYPSLNRAKEVFETCKSEYLESISSIKNEMIRKIELSNLEYEDFKKNYVKEKSEYDQFIEKNGSQLELEGKRKRINLLIQDVTEKIKIEDENGKLIKNINDERNKKLSAIEIVYKEFLIERKKKCESFEIASGNKLKIELEEATNNKIFKEKLSELKRGSRLRDSDIDNICNKISAKDFMFYLMRYYVSGGNGDKYIEEISKICLVDTEIIKKLYQFLFEQNTIENLLKLQYTARAEDRPNIKVLIDDNYEDIKNISIGQKCNAMLMIALSDGLYPVVIDQPEDSLDIKSIWDDICTRIRYNKVKRQFIFTTHNSSLAVASDTDKYIVVESCNGKGKILYSGAIDTKKIKENIIGYLEGGPETYINKYKKYGFKD